MLTQILVHTPLWVWGLFLALVWLGCMQLVGRVTSFGRVLRIGLGMAGYSLYGMISSPGASVPTLLLWLGAALTLGGLTLRIPLAPGVRYLPEGRAFELPGSWVPLLLMMSVFAVKYAQGVLNAMHAPLSEAPWFAPALALFYGAACGVFVGRAARLVRLARKAEIECSQAGGSGASLP